MSTPLLALPLSAPIPDAGNKKRVLLIDTSNAKRDLRADVLRKLGMDVDCAAAQAALFNLGAEEADTAEEASPSGGIRV